MAIVSKPYQAFPLFAPGIVLCGCGKVDPCLHYLTTDVIRFQVGLTECAFGDELIEAGAMHPIYSGTSSTSGSTLTDLSKDFTSGPGVQSGASCGYVVRNLVTDTYAFITVIVNASTLTLDSGLFTATGQAYQIYPWGNASAFWVFQGAVAETNGGVGGAMALQCNRGLIDNRLYVATIDVLESAGGTITVQVGGETFSDILEDGTHQIAFGPSFWSVDKEAGFGSTAFSQFDNFSLKQYSTLGIRITDCDGTEVLVDSANTHGWITYATDYIKSAAGIRAQVDIVWSETGLEDGCYQVCLYDLCGETDDCILESYSIRVTSTGYNYNYNEDNDPCELAIEWTNFEDFEIERGDYLNYPEYPGVAGYLAYTQLLRAFGKVRFTGFVSGDYTMNHESDGLREVVHYEGHETYELQLEPLPEPILRALAKGLGHDSFVIDGQPYVWADGEFAPSWRKSSESATVVVKLIKQYSKGENVNT